MHGPSELFYRFSFMTERNEIHIHVFAGQCFCNQLYTISNQVELCLYYSLGRPWEAPMS